MMHEKTVQFLEFCSKKPADRRYDWEDSAVCALGQFNHYQCWGEEFSLCNEIAEIRPRTFGALTERLRAFDFYQRTYNEMMPMMR